MATNETSPDSGSESAADLDFPDWNGMKQHPPRFLDPRVVDDHFRPLIKNPPSAEERWEPKKDAVPFQGL